MGRFELVIGEEQDGSPVFRQAHSGEIPGYDDVLLFRWENSPSPLLTRSDDEWRIMEKIEDPESEYDAQLKASVGGEPNKLPNSGWKFNDYDTGNWPDDPTLSCSIPSTSPPCCLTVSLSGAAKRAHGECEGEYKSIGLVIMGREVKLQFGQTFIFLWRCSSWKAPLISTSLWNMDAGKSVPTWKLPKVISAVGAQGKLALRIHAISSTKCLTPTTGYLPLMTMGKIGRKEESLCGATSMSIAQPIRKITKPPTCFHWFRVTLIYDFKYNTLSVPTDF